MGSEYEQPKPVVSPATPVVEPASNPAAKASIPASGAHSAERLVGLLLRRGRERAEGALHEVGEARSAHVMLASENVVSYLREVVEVARASVIDWRTKAHDLWAMRDSIERLDAELGEEALALKTQLATAFGTLVDIVPAPAWGAKGKLEPVKRSPDRERLELSREAIGAVRARLARLPAFDPKVDMRAQAIRFCEPLELHLRIAGDAALSVLDRRARHALKPDVEAVSDGMDPLAELLAMSPKLVWDRSFAAAFDAENALRADLGLVKRVRPYTGKVDPKAALDQVEGAAKHGAPAGSTMTFEDPQSAVEAVKETVKAVVDRQITGATRAGELLAEKEKHSEGWMDVLLGLAANTAISMAAGALGGLVATLLKPRLEKLNVGMVVPASALRQLADDERKMVVADILDRGALGRAIASDGLKDGSKEIFKSIAKLAREHQPAVLGADRLKNFIHIQTQKLEAAKLQSSLLVIQLGPALEQADLDLLNALVATLREARDRALPEQYDRTMREWQNVKAQLDAGPAPVHLATPQSGRDVDIRDQHVAGALEVGIDLARDRIPVVRSLRLFGAEPAARLHFRTLNLPLRDIGLNQRYQVRILANLNEETIVFGVGPDRGIMLESLGGRDLALLKVLADHDPLTSVNVVRAFRGEYDHVSDAAARRVVHGIVQGVEMFTTGHLEA